MTTRTTTERSTRLSYIHSFSGGSRTHDHESPRCILPLSYREGIASPTTKTYTKTGAHRKVGFLMDNRAVGEIRTHSALGRGLYRPLRLSNVPATACLFN